ncbi:MAG TPA: bifunctional UDP-N-acetylmuramoyl-tripeptide:D-alanyl-D-alanine ligase/alanine racemase [Bacteroidales bacterium]|nr:bifunctional UDP-N-acetylmuramoyl-tripeptide:D-alanyl-D-alanine ligase/alanine racemase [Bacteroidales bacterium]HPS73128.1 bifunctional UDP-N-acetylmuramoyl-tripeptide:D-alanyl-D-alanine ligase/alanine racemase [Bacteroidales bacterium]
MTFEKYTLNRICEITGGHILSSRTDDPYVRDLLIDSRRLVDPAGCLFVALVTQRNDGHRYIGDLYEKGVRLFMIRDRRYLNPGTDKETPLSGDGSPYPDAAFLVVNDTLTALQKLAAYHRSLFTSPVIGITGSNGKTIVKEWLFQLLAQDFRIIRSPRSFNSQIGVPLSVMKMEGGDDLAIIEAGISQPGEMEHLEPIIRPTIGLITNIGHAHDEHFLNAAQKATEKLKLFEHSKIIMYCSDYTVIREKIQSSPTLSTISTFTWSRTGEADLKITAVNKRGENTLIEGLFQGREMQITIPLTDEASIENAIHCWAVMLYLGTDPAVIAPRMLQLTPIALRLELKEAVNHCSLINDIYNSDINSLGIAIDFLLSQNQHPRRTVILSDILQSGRDKEELYRELGEVFAFKKIDRVIGIGKDISRYSRMFPMEGSFFLTTDDFLAHYPISQFRDETILLKGARLFEFEKISRVLQRKAHETVLEINLDALVHNLNYYRSKLKPGVKAMAMVKAFAYGSGSFEIANLMQFHRVDYLAVAYADEGVDLRKAGIRLPIAVMSPEEQSLDLLLKYNLEPEIYNIHILELIEKAIDRNQTALQDEVQIHIKLDTGMHRLGFNERDLDELGAHLQANPRLHVRSVFSHLAASEDPAEDEFTRRQIALFNTMSKKITQYVQYPFIRHILNSAGISRFPEAQLDMVRIGIGLYGVGFDEAEGAALRNVSTLKTVVTQVRWIPKGDTVGYNRKGVADTDKVIAVVPIGYADGLDRRLGNGHGKFYIGGKAAPVIGNICMDLVMLDVTELVNQGMDIREGEEAVLFSDEHPVTELAKLTGTIPYEILTSISPRVKRIYFHE